MIHPYWWELHLLTAEWADMRKQTKTVWELNRVAQWSWSHLYLSLNILVWNINVKDYIPMKLLSLHPSPPSSVIYTFY